MQGRIFIFIVVIMLIWTQITNELVGMDKIPCNEGVEHVKHAILMETKRLPWHLAIGIHHRS
jgi:hypothetical protein